MDRLSFVKFLLLTIIASSLIWTACSNSDYSVSQNTSNTPNDESSKDYLPLDDSNYPYANIPRIVIETENFKQVQDTETEISAKIQVYAEQKPITEITNIKIRGRGNSSFTYMPKKSYKIEFEKKDSLLSMKPNKDFALIANHIDKTLIKNFLTNKLSSLLNANFTPQNILVELYLNKEYKGVYLLSETIKVGSNRVNLPKYRNSYLVEFDEKFKQGEIVFPTKNGKVLNVHYPKNADSTEINIIRKRINTIEDYIFSENINTDSLKEFLDIDAYLLNYWIQEISKNNDGAFYTSVYFSWIEGEPLRMGPIWDFDQSYGSHSNKDLRNSEGWYIRNSYWNKSLFKDSAFHELAKKYWQSNHNKIISILDSIDSYKSLYKDAANNNFTRWKVLSDYTTYDAWKNQHYKSYDQALDSLKTWITRRVSWIDKNI